MAKGHDMQSDQEKAIQVKRLREGMNMTRVGLSQVSGVPLPTIEAYEFGKRTVPQSYMDMVQERHDRDKELMRQIIDGVSADIDQNYPHGIPSEVKV
jgi:type III secretory pathway component EscV